MAHIRQSRILALARASPETAGHGPSSMPTLPPLEEATKLECNELERPPHLGKHALPGAALERDRDKLKGFKDLCLNPRPDSGPGLLK